MQTDAKKLQDLSCEVRRKEEWLQEERMEREKIEVELGRERDCTRVLQSDSKRELQELKVGLRAAQKEREEQQAEKQELLIHILQLEQRWEVETESKEEVPISLSPGSSSEDEENVSSASSRSILSPLFLSTPLERPHRAETPVAETPVSDTQ
nr:calcium-binding and coiled-coil domain-containing protein 1-like [Pseudochaenichthys georgianus]